MIENVLFRRVKDSFVACEILHRPRLTEEPLETERNPVRIPGQTDAPKTISLRRLYASQMICGGDGEVGGSMGAESPLTRPAPFSPLPPRLIERWGASPFCRTRSTASIFARAESGTD